MEKASVENKHAEGLRDQARKRRQVLDGLTHRAAQLRSEVKSEVADQRKQHNHQVHRLRQNSMVQATMAEIEAETSKDHAEGMRLRESAAQALNAAHQLSAEAATMEKLADSMKSTAQASLNDAKVAAEQGRARAKAELKKSVLHPAKSKAKANMYAGEALSVVQSKTSIADKLLQEAAAYRHEATQFHIQADVAAAKAPSDLAAAAKELKAAKVLARHVKIMKRALHQAALMHQQRLQQMSPAMQKQNAEKEELVHKLASVMKQEAAVQSGISELKQESIETSDKARSDSRGALQQRNEAMATLKAARESEVEDEGRMREQRRRWRLAQQEEASLARS